MQPIFVTIISAAFYDFREMGPFFFVGGNCSDLREFYGENIESYTINELSAAIEGYIEKSRI